jgi:hypothetical protein
MSSNEATRGNHPADQDHDKPDNFVEVSISTTAGFYPEDGYDRVPANQKVEVQLKKAEHKLGIKDTAGWVATVTLPSGKKAIDITKSYRENGLSGKAEIDWGPSEGGGG